MRPTKFTKAQAIARKLADEITAGRFAPGTSLDEADVAARYGVSRTPIREAIRELTAMGMLDTRAHRGAVVRVIGEQELDNMFAVMADLEALCARGAARTITVQQLTELDEILLSSVEPAMAGDVKAYGLLNERFHTAVLEAAHNSYLLQLTRDTHARLAPCRRAQFEAPGRLQKSLAEHRHIVSAIRSGDAAAAFDTMRAHIVVVREAVDRVPADRLTLHTS